MNTRLPKKQCQPHQAPSPRPHPRNLSGWARGIACLFLLAAVLAGTASAYTTAESIEAASNVYVSDTTWSPGSFYPGDTGTVTVKVTHGNTGTGGVVNHATLYDLDGHFKVTSPPFTSTTTIGPGQTQTFVFSVTADSMGEGTFQPVFSLSFRDANSLWHRTSVQIEDALLELTVTARPDTFTEGGKGTVKVLVWNPRETTVRSVAVIPSGEGTTTTPIKAYIGELGPGESQEVSFEITPSQETTLTFTAEYLNGVNPHTASIEIPVAFGTDKKGAEIVINNIESSSSAGTMIIKGDVTNNGLTDARSVLVTVKSPAAPVNPNPVYAIGNLEPDDFSSFEVTYTLTGGPSLPLVVEYKDNDGNVFSETFTINTGSNTVMGASGAIPGAVAGGQMATGERRPGGMFGSFGSGMNQIPVTEIVIVLIVLITLAVAWRKGYLKPVTERFRRKPADDEDLLPQDS
jgi:hypothetical protein